MSVSLIVTIYSVSQCNNSPKSDYSVCTRCRIRIKRRLSILSGPPCCAVIWQTAQSPLCGRRPRNMQSSSELRLGGGLISFRCRGQPACLDGRAKDAVEQRTSIAPHLSASRMLRGPIPRTRHRPRGPGAGHGQGYLLVRVGHAAKAALRCGDDFIWIFKCSSAMIESPSEQSLRGILSPPSRRFAMVLAGQFEPPPGKPGIVASRRT